MNYARPPFPRLLFSRFCQVAKALGHDRRGEKWKLLDMLLSYAEMHSDLFRKR